MNDGESKRVLTELQFVPVLQSTNRSSNRPVGRWHAILSTGRSACGLHTQDKVADSLGINIPVCQGCKRWFDIRGLPMPGKKESD